MKLMVGGPGPVCLHRRRWGPLNACNPAMSLGPGRATSLVGTFLRQHPSPTAIGRPRVPSTPPVAVSAAAPRVTLETLLAASEPTVCGIRNAGGSGTRHATRLARACTGLWLGRRGTAPPCGVEADLSSEVRVHFKCRLASAKPHRSWQVRERRGGQGEPSVRRRGVRAVK